ncbi:hypothetical protein [Halorussus marinus]|uniref:hypothetical protein n=1 Tax=Halorussus marinus TaxID=2505976 RepID=UPI0010925CE9|nr:hypothetical protein [Halorussus marinus]
MSSYDKAKLTLPPCDPANSGNDVTGTFVFEGNLTIEMGTRTGFIFDGAGSSINSILSSWYEDATGEELSGNGKRQGLYLDLGGGIHFAEISFQGVEGWTGSDSQWGDTGDPSQVTPTDATAANAITQLQVLDRYLQVCTIDSASTATLEVGEYSTNGLYDPLQVVVESPRFTFDAEEQSSVFDGSLTFLEAASLTEAIDGRNQRE